MNASAVKYVVNYSKTRAEKPLYAEVGDYSSARAFYDDLLNRGFKFIAIRKLSRFGDNWESKKVLSYELR
jgi:hypothetical protein